MEQRYRYPFTDAIPYSSDLLAASYLILIRRAFSGGSFAPPQGNLR
ncbi:hypothetical protein HMPREF1556_01730 [Porphyromonas sp. oral taxon 278 str. W7784]|nr:hypothetical protein HMPREF1556_01730 [Porphyromonas sp. oral taxon 278 str. W7784]